MKIHLLTDSGSDITQQEASAMGITVLPLKTRFGDQEFLDGVTITTREFFERLVESDEFPKTSQIPPQEYEQAFAKALQSADHVLCITISSKLSGCCQSACIASQSFPGRVTVIDSENVTLGQRNLIDDALRLLAQSDDPALITAQLEQDKKKICLVALLDTLEYLKKGGRISAAAALAGSLLSIKPVIAIDEGEIAVLGKARGSRNGNNLLSQCVQRRGEIDYDKPYCLAYSGFSDQLLQKYLADNAPFYQIDAGSIPVHQIGSTIGTHVGPGAIAVSFFVR